MLEKLMESPAPRGGSPEAFNEFWIGLRQQFGLPVDQKTSVSPDIEVTYADVVENRKRLESQGVTFGRVDDLASW